MMKCSQCDLGQIVRVLELIALLKKGLFTVDCFLQAIFTFPIMFQNPLGADMFNSLPNDKILDWSKLKAFADDIINMNEKLKF